MKRLLIIAMAVLLLALTACSGDNDGADTKKDTHSHQTSPSDKTNTNFSKDSETIKENAAGAVKALDEKPAYQEGFPTLQDVADQYKKANMAIGWIVGTEKVATDPKDTFEYDGLVYERVRPDCYYGIDELTNNKELSQTVGLIYNLETLEKYFATLISKEEASEYMYDNENGFDVKKFVEDENGALYALPYGFAAQGYTNEESYELTDNGNGTFTFNVTYGTIDGNTHTENFTYQEVEGRWVFTDFYVIKQH